MLVGDDQLVTEDNQELELALLLLDELLFLQE